MFSFNKDISARFLSLARSKLRLYSANHWSGYWRVTCPVTDQAQHEHTVSNRQKTNSSSLACDWLNIELWGVLCEFYEKNERESGLYVKSRVKFATYAVAYMGNICNIWRWHLFYIYICIFYVYFVNPPINGSCKIYTYMYTCRFETT